MSTDPIEIVLATRNEGKVKEIERILSDLPVQFKPMSRLGDIPEIIESEPTLQGNAIKKAQTLFDYTGIPSLADDTGLEVDALSGQPGVRSARFAGENATDADNRALLLNKLTGCADRTARFCTVIAYIDPEGIFLFEGACEGRIRSDESGAGGFGYDSIFEPDGFAISFAEMSVESKNRISHRGKALQKFRAFLFERTASL